MGYRHINNLYKNQTVLMFKRLFALEKIHGTSAHISFFKHPEHEIDEWGTKEEAIYDVTFFSGGEKHDNFVALFDQEVLLKKFEELGFDKLTVYGEAYGGKQQGMSGTYGKELKFVAFEVRINNKSVGIPYGEHLCKELGLEFVHYEEIDADPEVIDRLANAPSVQAKRNGVENPTLPREGIVLRPLIEFLYPDGEGIVIAKHKNDLYKEREHTPKLKNPEELKVLEDAKAIAQEWVTPMRLNHVIDKLKVDGEIGIEKMQHVIKAMIEDIYREAKGEIVEGKAVRKAISKITAKLFQQKLKDSIKKEESLWAEPLIDSIKNEK